MRQPLHSTLRRRLGPRSRARVRAVGDLLLAPFVGSYVRFASTTSVALTFDDGPDPDITPALIDLLAAYAAPSTFFVLVDQAERFPHLLKDLRAAGHEIALHGRDHRRVSEMSLRQSAQYLRRARAELEDLCGTSVTLYRPPYGAQTLASHVGARQAGLRVVTWNADAEDWVERPPTAVAERALDRLSAGGILLLHERLEPDPLRGAPETTFDRVAMVRHVLDRVAARGWSARTVGELMESGNPQRSAWFRP
jgi:peptidoglycan/xylan/chitin deacetylase (PgdA/CDA1 family)